MADIWSILGLDGPVEDVKAIKKAYAKKLRVTRPDDDPEGFMALREALENAVNYARFYRENEFSHDSKPIKISADGPGLEPRSAPPPEPITTAGPMTTAELVEPAAEPSAPDIVIEKIAKLLRTPARAYQQAWSDLLDDDILETIDDQIDFEDKLRSFLLEKFGYFDGDESRHNQNYDPRMISPLIARIIFDKMGWNDVQSRPYYVQDQIGWLRTDLGAPAKKPYYSAEKYKTRNVLEQDGDMRSLGFGFGGFILAFFFISCLVRFILHIS